MTRPAGTAICEQDTSPPSDADTISQPRTSFAMRVSQAATGAWVRWRSDLGIGANRDLGLVHVVRIPTADVETKA
jgi:hypothetical protein